MINNEAHTVKTSIQANGQPAKHIALVAGEASGDMHAAHLVSALKTLDPSLRFSGLGGTQMQAQSVELYQDLTRLAVVGFWEVLRHYANIKKAFDLFLQKVDADRPDAVILIDYPGFNLRLAREIKKRKIPVIYYISPQVWAWKKNRVYSIKKNVDKMLVLFRFEKDFYARYGIDAQWVGHPLVDSVKAETSKENFLNKYNYSSDKLTIGLLPGSRNNEIEKLLPAMRKAAEILAVDFPQAQFLVIKAPTIDVSLIERHLINAPLKYIVIHENIYDGMGACDYLLVTSGTATLEAAIQQKPMVIIYKTALITWALAKLFIKIRDIGLVNIIAGRRVVPECVQFQATGKNIAHELKAIMTNELRIADIRIDLKEVKESLGPKGASRRAAETVLEVLGTWSP